MITGDIFQMLLSDHVGTKFRSMIEYWMAWSLMSTYWTIKNRKMKIRRTRRIFIT